MFDNIIYKTLDIIVTWCEKYRSYIISKDIPKHDPKQLKNGLNKVE
jgi:hypothetical protein